MRAPECLTGRVIRRAFREAAMFLYGQHANTSPPLLFLNILPVILLQHFIFSLPLCYFSQRVDQRLLEPGGHPGEVRLAVSEQQAHVPGVFCHIVFQ